ncbi:sulfotransferase family protein [Nocardioides solisilvae]|uniref:sulfotransferase family protein n=1 Tax=Nocardioides solisilvae TaxID=1542435 RepID=UPI000D74A36F|nr:sulfotransferase family protein [Nocardioides solisilvae]
MRRSRESPSPRTAATAETLFPEGFRTREGDRFKLTVEAQETLGLLAEQASAGGWVSPLGYNLTVSHSHRFVWYRVAKVATRTIRHHFASHGVSLDADHAMRVRYPTAAFSDYLKFAFVRDPLERFVSAWQDKVVNMNYFKFDETTHARMQVVEEFARWTAEHDLGRVPGTDQHLALQSRLIDLSSVDFVGRLESFDRDFAEVCDRVGAPAVPTRPQNQTAPGGRRDDVSDELRELVAGMYRRDYQIFGY